MTLLLFMMLGTFASLGPLGPGEGTCPALAARPEWVSEDGEFHLRYDVDVDGDGRPDHLEGEESSGSGSGSVSLSLRLTRSGRRIEIDQESNFYSMVDFTEIPEELQAPGNECALLLFERAFIHDLAGKADPSLEWLLTPAAGRKIVWIPGPPVLPASYGIRDGGLWIFYRGGHHSDRVGITSGGAGAVPPVELARRGDQVLLGTPHGVILTDPKRTRHAWIYVSMSGGHNKLRLPSIRGAEIKGNEALVHLEEGAREGPLLVRVDLTTGRIR